MFFISTEALAGLIRAAGASRLLVNRCDAVYSYSADGNLINSETLTQVAKELNLTTESLQAAFLDAQSAPQSLDGPGGCCLLVDDRAAPNPRLALHDLSNDFQVLGLAMSPARAQASFDQARHRLHALRRAIEGKPNREQKNASVSETVYRALAALAPLAHTRNVRLEQAVEPCNAVCDQDALGTALSNLVGNALHVSPAGSRVRVEGKATHDEYTVKIDDEGPGYALSPDWSNWAPGTSTREGGSGLGLASVRSALRPLDGTLACWPRAEGGTRAELTIPLRQSSTRAARPPRTSGTRLRAGSAGSVLIADDQVELRELLGSVLEASGYTVMMATSAEDASRYVGQSFDMVIVDVHLGDGSGIDILHALCEHGDVRHRIIMSGEAVTETHGALPDGSTWLRKPFDLADLEAAIAPEEGIDFQVNSA